MLNIYSISNGNNAGYVKARGIKNKVHVTIKKAKGLGQRFEGRRRGRPKDVFNIIIQKRPNNTVDHLKVDDAMEGRRSHKEMRSS